MSVGHFARIGRMKAIMWSSVLALITVILTGCATGSSSPQSSAAPNISGYVDTSIEYRLK